MFDTNFQTLLIFFTIFFCIIVDIFSFNIKSAFHNGNVKLLFLFFLIFYYSLITK